MTLPQFKGYQIGCLSKTQSRLAVQFSESTVTSVMTEAEIREKVGLQVVQTKEDSTVDSKTKDAQAALKGSVGGVSGIITLTSERQRGSYR
jgi:hypothetical protein